MIIISHTLGCLNKQINYLINNSKIPSTKKSMTLISVDIVRGRTTNVRPLFCFAFVYLSKCTFYFCPYHSTSISFFYRVPYLLLPPYHPPTKIGDLRRESSPVNLSLILSSSSTRKISILYSGWGGG